MSVRLWIHEPDGKPRSIPLDAERVVVGRGEDCGIVLKDESVSRDHAEISRHGAVLLLTDLDSRNGTLLNGQRVERPRKLSAGDVVQIGGTRLEVSGPSEPSVERTVPRDTVTVELSADERAVATALVRPYLKPGALAPRPATRQEIADEVHASPRTVQRRLDALALRLRVASDPGDRDRPRLIAEKILALGLYSRD